MSLATSSPSSQTNTIPPPPSSTAAAASSSLSPSSGFYHHRRIRQQQQHQQHFSTLVTAGLGQPQPVSAPLPTSLPTQLFNCTFNKNSDDNNNNNNHNKMIDNHPTEFPDFNVANKDDGQPECSNSDNDDTRTAKIKQQAEEEEEEKEADKTNNNHINAHNRLKKEDDKTIRREDSFNDNVNEFKNETPISESPKTIVRRWSENFHSLIMNVDGLDLFKEYMAEVGLSHMLDFYFACKGLKQSHPEKRLVIVKAIIRRFILNPNQLSLSNQCRHKLLEAYRQEMAAKASRQQCKNNNDNNNNDDDDRPVYLDENTLNEAYLEIENQLKDAIYHNFLKSQIYLNYVNDLMKLPSNNHVQCDDVGGQNQCQRKSQTVQESTEVGDQQPKNFDDQPGPESMPSATAAEDEPFELEFNPFKMPTIVETSEDGDHSTMVMPTTKIPQQQPPPPLLPRPQPLPTSRVFPPMTNNNNNNNNNKSSSSSSSSSSLSCRGEWPTFKLYTLDPNDSSKNNRTYGLEQQPPSGPPNPYHVNAHVQYSTVQYNSKKDSEIESISSSDSSFVSKYNDKKSSSLRNSSGNNNNNNGRINLISNNNGGSRPIMLHRQQRTSQQQQVKNRLIASENPDEFARRLIEKLNQVKKDQIIGQRLLKMLEQAEQERIQGSAHGGQQQQQQREAGVGQYSQSSSSNNNNNMCTVAKSAGPTKSGLGQALKKFDFSVLGDPGESGQSILDEHFSKVFETPNADSPVATLSNQCDHIHYLGGTMMDGVGSGGGGGVGVGMGAGGGGGGGSSSMTMMHTLPPPSPLSPSRQFLAQFGQQSSVQSATAAATTTTTISIPVYAKFSTEEMPHKLTMLGPHITLFQFKQQIPRKSGIQQFYFKRPCTELERQEIDANFVLDQIKDDATILPLCDGKIHALIEIN